MTALPDWLPEPLSFAGDWDAFLAEVYSVFERDFKHSRITFEGRPVTHDATLEYAKEAAFWHLVSAENAMAQERVPDLRRCERVGWPKPIIVNHTDTAVSMWKNVRKKPGRRGQTRILLWLEQLDYLVVMAEMRRVTVFVTAYPTDRPHTRRKLRKECETYHQMQKPPLEAT